MPSPCAICTHPDRDRINLAIVEGASVRKIAGEYPTLSKTSVARHVKAHVPNVLRRAKAVRGLARSLPPAEPTAMQVVLPPAEIAQADKLLDTLDFIEKHALDLVDTAFEGDSIREKAMALREMRATLEIRARLEGRLNGIAESGTIDSRIQTVIVVNTLAAMNEDDLRALIARQTA